MSGVEASEISRSEYSLSWEEFLELYSNHWPKANLVAVITTLAFAVIIVAFGVLLAEAVDRQDSGAVWMFWALPFLLVLLAAWELAITPKQRKKRKLKEIKSTFTRFYSKPQVFGFDGYRWIHETESGKKETTWSGLLTMSIRPHALVLATKDDVAVVPSRVLDGEQVQILKASAIGNVERQFRFANSFLEWASGTFVELWKKNAVVLLLIHAGAASALVMMIQRLGSPLNATDFFWGELLCVVVLAMGLLAQFWYLPLKYFTIDKESRSPVTVELSDRGIWFQRPELQFFRSWTSFRRMEENTYCFLLYYSAKESFILGKASVPHKKAEEFRNLVRTYLIET